MLVLLLLIGIAIHQHLLLKELCNLRLEILGKHVQVIRGKVAVLVGTRIRCLDWSATKLLISLSLTALTVYLRRLGVGLSSIPNAISLW